LQFAWLYRHGDSGSNWGAVEVVYPTSFTQIYSIEIGGSWAESNAKSTDSCNIRNATRGCHFGYNTSSIKIQRFSGVGVWIVGI